MKSHQTRTNNGVPQHIQMLYVSLTGFVEMPTDLLRLCSKLLSRQYSSAIEDNITFRLQQSVVKHGTNDLPSSSQLIERFNNLITSLQAAIGPNLQRLLVLFENLALSSNKQPILQLVPLKYEAASSWPTEETLKVVNERKNAMQSNSRQTMRKSAEDALIRDILCVIQGMNGFYIKLDADNARYVINPCLNLSLAEYDITLSICEAGWFFHRISAYISKQNDRGIVSSALSSAFQSELCEYLRLMATLEAQASSDGLSLRKLYLWSRQPCQLLRMLASIADGVCDLRGGMLISRLMTYQHYQGNLAVVKMIDRVCQAAMIPVYNWIDVWMREGHLIVDTFDEFFVSKSDTSASDGWSSRYLLRAEMVPSYLSHDQAQNILITGKSVDFIRNSCGDFCFQQQHHVNVNEYLINLVLNKFKLMSHLKSLKRYLLLCSGDFSSLLLESTSQELKKPANHVSRLTINGHIESALRYSSSSHDTSDPMSRLFCILLPSSSGDVGWDIFSLDYRIDDPLDSIISHDAMVKYRTVFNLIWRLKRCSWNLSCAWQDDMMLMHRNLTSTLRHKCMIIRSQMIHFISILLNYIKFEVIQACWNDLKNDIEHASSLDAIIQAHGRYMDRIIEGVLLDYASEKLMTSLKRLLAVIHSFSALFESITTDMLIQASSVNRGNSSSNLAIQLDECIGLYQTRFMDLLKTLSQFAEKGSESLKFLVFRLDFNEFYSFQRPPAASISISTLSKANDSISRERSDPVKTSSSRESTLDTLSKVESLLSSLDSIGIRPRANK